MVDTRIILSGIWISVMLTYLLGDVLRIFAGDFEPGKISGVKATGSMWMMAAVMMLIPIVMVTLTLILPYPVARWTVLVAAALMIVFNLFGLPYPGAYDNFLIIVGILFKMLILWYAWNWTVQQ